MITTRRFRGGAEGAVAPSFFLYFQNVLPLTVRCYFENRYIKCSLILSSETFKLLYFASRIRPQYCMLHVLKSEVFISGGWGWGETEGGGLGPLFLNFQDPPLFLAFSLDSIMLLLSFLPRNEPSIIYRLSYRLVEIHTMKSI